MSGAQTIMLHPYHGMPLITLPGYLGNWGLLRPNMLGGKKEGNPPRRPGFGMDIQNMCVTFQGVSLN